VQARTLMVKLDNLRGSSTSGGATIAPLEAPITPSRGGSSQFAVDGGDALAQRDKVKRVDSSISMTLEPQQSRTVNVFVRTHLLTKSEMPHEPQVKKKKIEIAICFLNKIKNYRSSLEPSRCMRAKTKIA